MTRVPGLTITNLYMNSVCARIPGSTYDLLVVCSSCIPQQMADLAPRRNWLAGKS